MEDETIVATAAKQSILIKTDSMGDTFVSGYNKYLKEDTADTAKMHLNQFIRNYESCFGETPTPEELDNAFKFISMFFGEICETHAPTRYSSAVGQLLWIIGNDTVETVENLSSIK